MNRRKVVSLLMCLCLTAPVLTGCAATDNLTLLKINDNGDVDKVTYGYGKFNARLTQALYDVTYQGYMGDDMWQSDPSNMGTTMEESVKKTILSNMKEQYVLVKHASDYDVKLSKKDKQKIEKAAKKFMKANSKKAIKELGATEEYTIKYLSDKAISDKVRDKIEEKAKADVTDAEANQKKASVVFFNNISKTDANGNNVAVTSEDTAKFKEQAEKLSQAADFSATAKELGLNVGTLTYGKEEMKSAKKSNSISDSLSQSIPYEVLQDVDKLAEGETSKVIEKDQGFFVIRMDSLSDKEATETAKANMIQKKKTDYYQNQVAKFEAKIAWKLNGVLWNRIRFIDTFKGSLNSTDSKTK